MRVAGAPPAVNDGPALRAALVPARAQDQGAWEAALGWPNDPAANPCLGDAWDGLTCNSDGRVTAIDLGNRHDLPGYVLTAAVANLTQLNDM